LSGCSAGDLNFSHMLSPIGGPPAPQGQSFGSGPVQVAMLLPLSGDPSLTPIGTSMRNGAQLAMEFVGSSPSMKDNITLTIKDTGTTAQGAAQAATDAVTNGASLILGPLRSDQVSAVAGVARPAGIPVIAFSNNPGAAQPGVYLLNVLPGSETHRTLGYAKGQGRKAFAGLFPTTSAGQVQQTAFTQTASELGLRVVGLYTFGSQADAQDAVNRLLPLLTSGQVDALFLPDRASAPTIAALLAQAKVDTADVTIIGSADWNGDPQILAAPALTGAIYPALDDAGYQAILPQYQQRFGGTPHPLVTIAYTAVVLANASTLALATPKYDSALLTSAGGFNGRDGVFRFLSDGRSQYALVIKKVQPGGAVVVDGAKL
jgi:ABC-type branched-subunit amino acid transport system substrate-binding protein